MCRYVIIRSASYVGLPLRQEKSLLHRRHLGPVSYHTANRSSRAIAQWLTMTRDLKADVAPKLESDPKNNFKRSLNPKGWSGLT